MALICLGLILGQAFATPLDLSKEDSGNLEGSEFEDSDLDNEIRGILTKQKCSRLVTKFWGLYKKCMEKGKGEYSIFTKKHALFSKW